MLLIGLILALVGVLVAVFWRKDAGLVLAIVGIVFLLVALLTGDASLTA